MATRVDVAEGADGERGVPGDAEMHMLEEELLEAKSTLVGEVLQIESLAQEKNKKVWAPTIPQRCFLSSPIDGSSLH